MLITKEVIVRFQERMNNMLNCGTYAVNNSISNTFTLTRVLLHGYTHFKKF